VNVSLEDRTLAKIETMLSADDLRTLMRNAKGKSDRVYQRALERLVQVSASDHDDPVACACWQMVYAIEEIRRGAGRKVWRMNRLRPKIEREGERAALEYCAINQTDGFQEVLDYGLPQYTEEAIVLGFPTAFPAGATRTAASVRLKTAGIDPTQFEIVAR